MAAAATASTTVQSSLSTPKPSFAFLSNKQLPSDPIQVKFGSTKKSYAPLISQHYCFTNESTPIACVSHKRRAPRIAAAVAEEGVVETADDVEQEKDEAQIESEGSSEKNNNEVQVNTKLYFGNLPYHCDSAQLAGIVQEYGTPELVEVLYNRDTGKSRGFAFVTMSSVEDCSAVIENLDGSEYGGRYLRVNFADNPRKREPLFPETDHKLFVGNLSWSVTSESLYQAFQEYGKVVGARVLFDGETGKSRGYGFVCYSTRSEMEKALESLNGVELEGRQMRVSLAEGKKL
ncbi:28 kDa ribonucleoprotein, chloroplastic-like [Chenopodium quinoa]|uniref:28 kDa ribonucleoprotein, chloroplastic-like n=1 Tax=Chenopodium quinoa TaxID=63459 RepID=UPI000B78E6F8|nr:28 kDa ribonucleoprotein, chloroplastic-like [Chenopodium quinoa]